MYESTLNQISFARRVECPSGLLTRNIPSLCVIECLDISACCIDHFDGNDRKSVWSWDSFTYAAIWMRAFQCRRLWGYDCVGHMRGVQCLILKFGGSKPGYETPEIRPCIAQALYTSGNHVGPSTQGVYGALVWVVHPNPHRRRGLSRGKR